MKSVWTILLMTVLVMALLACQTAELSTAVPVETASQTDTPESHPENNTTLILSQEETDVPPVTPPNEAAEGMVTLVKQHLAQRLSITVDQIMLSEVKSVVWRDAGLGCPKPAIDYIPMETAGYKIVVEAGGQTYTYHTDAGKRFVLCNRP